MTKRFSCGETDKPVILITNRDIVAPNYRSFFFFFFMIVSCSGKMNIECGQFVMAIIKL